MSKVRHRWFALGGALAVLAVGSARADDTREVSVAEFEKLHKQLAPPRDEAWQNIPWKLSILDAQAVAAKEKKPIFMLVRSGHPLGCV